MTHSRAFLFRFSELGQVVKVEVTREYECLTTIQKKIAEQKNAKQMQDNDIMSSFKPASNAKLYASPQELKSVGYRIQPANNNTEVCFLNGHYLVKLKFY